MPSNPQAQMEELPGTVMTEAGELRQGLSSFVTRHFQLMYSLPIPQAFIKYLLSRRC